MLARVAAVAAVVAACAAGVSGRQTTSFKGEARIYDDPQVTGALMTTLYYDEPLVRIDYRVVGTPIEVTNYTSNVRYLGCGTDCEAETRPGQFPRFYNEPSDTAGGSETVYGRSCTIYTKADADASGGVTTVSMQGGLPCRVTFTNGKKIDFTSAPSGTPTSAEMTIHEQWMCPQQQCSTMMDIEFVLDESGSISSGNFADMKDFVLDVVNDYEVSASAAYFGVIMFSRSARVGVRLKTSKNSFQASFSTVTQSSGYTCVHCGTDLAWNSLRFENNARASAAKIMIVLTDGENNVNNNGDLYFDGSYSLAPKMNALHNQGVILFAIGVDGYDINELRLIASNIPGVTTVFEVLDFSQLQSITNQLVTATCLELPANPCGAQCGGFCTCGRVCVCPDDCSDGDLCTTDNGCQAGVLPNRCTWTPVDIDDANLCTVDSCDPATGVVNNSYDPSQCPGRGRSCETPVCNPQTGACSFVVDSICNDNVFCTRDECGPSGCTHTQIPNCTNCATWVNPNNDSCTVYSCDLATGATIAATGSDACANVQIIDNGILRERTPCTPGVCTRAPTCNSPETCCTFPPTDCNVDGDPCTIDTCNNVTGLCESRPNPCDDDNNCTRDFCTANVGCQHELRTDVCNTTNPCKVPQCVNECVRPAGASPLDPCTFQIRCSEQPRNCSEAPGVQGKVNDCFFAECGDQGCLLSAVDGSEVDDCGNCIPEGADRPICIPVNTSVAVGIGAGVIAAIIIGIIVALVLCGAGGAGAYKAFSAYRGNMAGAQSNPLFEQKNMDGENPMYAE